MSSLHLNPIFRGGNTSHTDCLYCALSSSIVSSGYSEKKPAEYCKTPLLPPDLEASVINFIPKGEWLYIATVCKRWREIYLQKCRGVGLGHFHLDKDTRIVSCAMASLNRLDVAAQAGLPLNTKKWISIYLPSLGKSILKPVQFVAAMLARKNVLERAKGLGMRWDAEVCYGAAQAGRLDLVMVKAPNSDVLHWLHRMGIGKWPDLSGPRTVLAIECHQWYTTTLALGRIENAKYLLSVGAMWHPFTCYAAAIGNHVKFLEWARHNGCYIKWGGYRCSYARSRGMTQQTLSWVHEQDGCLPCGECDKIMDR